MGSCCVGVSIQVLVDCDLFVLNLVSVLSQVGICGIGGWTGGWL